VFGELGQKHEVRSMPSCTTSHDDPDMGQSDVLNWVLHMREDLGQLYKRYQGHGRGKFGYVGVVGFLLMPCLAFPTRAADAKPAVNPAWRHELVIEAVDDGKWGCEPENARQVMLSAAGTLWKYFPDRKMPRIEVVPKGGPIFYYGIGRDEHVRVCLASGDALWAQIAYQFAHEFCHLLCHIAPKNENVLWFHESMCETASRFALQRMSETWKTHPPYSNWKSYAPHLRTYFDDLQKKGPLPPDKTFGQWYRENAAALAAEGCDRPRNHVVAGMLYELLDANPESWQSLSYLPQEKLAPGTFEHYLRAWHDNCPEKHKAFVTDIARKFEVELDNTP
jgi:hypothetical protein